MKSLVLAAMVAASPPHKAAIDAKLTALVIAERIDTSITITNNTHRDLCFYQSMSLPRLFDKDGKELPVFDAGSEISVWTPPNELQFVRRNEEGSFDYSIGPSERFRTNADLRQLAKVSLDVDVFDCIAFHTLSPEYPYNRKMKAIAVHTETEPNFDPLLHMPPVKP